MSSVEHLRRRRAVVEQRLEAYGLFATVSVARFQLSRVVRGVLCEYATGQVLEAGAGSSPYADTLRQTADVVETLDIEVEKCPDIVGDIQNMAMIADATYDTILSTQVLEHVPRPQEAFREFRRVLRRDGTLIVTVPHLSVVHEAPHDYFRFTEFALRALCRNADLEVVRIVLVGGPVSFLGHIASLGWMTLIASLPGLFWPAWALNYLSVRALDVVDRLMGFRTVLPRDILLVARAVRSDQ